MAKRLTKQDVAATTRVLRPDATFTSGDGTSFQVELASVTLPFSGVPRFTEKELLRIADRDVPVDQWFKGFRESKIPQKSYYEQEWLFLQSLPDKGSCEWRMLALSLCAQVAIETSFAYPFLHDQAYKWRRAKFVGQGTGDDFDDRWLAYKELCIGDPPVVDGTIYLRLAGTFHFSWVGELPAASRSCHHNLKLEQIE